MAWYIYYSLFLSTLELDSSIKSRSGLYDICHTNVFQVVEFGYTSKKDKNFRPPYAVHSCKHKNFWWLGWRDLNFKIKTEFRQRFQL
jgi:hypothetical protein